jgi:polyphosphate kinase 2 (PPK2 family)
MDTDAEMPMPGAKTEEHPGGQLPGLRHDSEAIHHAFETGEYPYQTKLKRGEYERQKALLQAELLKVQLWTQETGQKFVLLFEGRDAAGTPTIVR